MIYTTPQPQDQSEKASDFQHSMEFIQSWYRNRDISNKAILKNFGYERITIKDYLAPHVSRGVIKCALDTFRDNLIYQIEH